MEEDRVRRRVRGPEGALRLDRVRDECGAKIKVVLEELLRLILLGIRDEYRPKILEQRREQLRFVDRPLRDERAAGGPAP